MVLEFLRRQYRVSDGVVHHFSNYLGVIAAYSKWTGYDVPINEYRALTDSKAHMPSTYIATFFDLSDRLEALLEGENESQCQKQYRWARSLLGCKVRLPLNRQIALRA